MKPVEPKPQDDMHLLIFGKDQPQYNALPALSCRAGRVVTEWELSAEDLVKLMDGARVRVSILTFGQPLQPIQVEVA